MIFVTVSLFAVGAFAQFEQGNVRIGGASNLDFSNTKYSGTNYSSNNLSLAVEGGYFFMDNLAVDVDANLTFSKSSSNAVPASTLFGVGLGARYYLPVNVFVGAGVDIFNVKYFNNTEFGTGVKAKVGYAAFLSDNIALEPSISYRLGLTDENKGTKIDGLYVQIGFSIFFYYFATPR